MSEQEPVLDEGSGRSVGLDLDLGEPSTRWAAGRIAQAVEGRGGALITTVEPRPDLGLMITAGIDPALDDSGLDDQGYDLSIDGRSCHLVGGGRAGLMYGLLRIAETIRDHGPEHLAAESVRPHLRNRGIKFNLPLDARTPSYSDDGDSAPPNIAVVWEFEFWRELLDQLAAERYNLISLWNLHPFPSMVAVPEYPAVALTDVMQGTVLPGAHTTGIGMFHDRVAESMITVRQLSITEKIEFWRSVLQLAHDRCIDVLIFTWNVFTYGTEQNPYGIDDSMDSQPGKDYLRASVRALLQTYPLLAGIGVTAGEHMDRHAAGSVNQQWLRDTYGAAVNDVRRTQPDRQIRLIHRTHWADMAEIERLFADVDAELEFSYKYSSAHMHALTRPTYIDDDGFLEAMPDGSRFWLTVRDDDYYLLRPGDPEFARSYLTQLPGQDRLNGFYLGPDGYTIGREFLTYPHPDADPAVRRQLVVDRQWYFFAAYGQLGYDPSLPTSYFVGRLAGRYPGADAELLYRAWRQASSVIPTVNKFHYGGNRFDLHWYAEACMSHLRQRHGFHTVHDFIRCEPMSTSGMISIPDAHAGRSDGTVPLEVADQLEQAAAAVDEAVDLLGRGRPDRVDTGAELGGLLDDLAALALLGRYYAAKIRGAVDVHALTVEPPGDPDVRRSAVGHLTRAAEHWKRYADLVHTRYRPQRLSRLGAALIDLHVLETEVRYDITLARSAGYDEYSGHW